MTASTLTRRLLAAGPFAGPDLASHLDQFGRRPHLTPRSIVEAVAAAGLTGHGGAGFPTHRKLAAVRAAGRSTVVVGNAAEGEPASRKDHALLAKVPHLVLDGLQLAADAVGADQLHLYLARDAHPAAERALAQRSGLGERPVRLHIAADRFVSGEETAVVAAVNGRAALPRDKARRVVEHGVAGRPTLVQNVETLAHLALIARYGPQWFRGAGTADEPGTFLATISGAVHTPGVREFPYGVSLGTVLDAADGPTSPLWSVLIGGFHGAWVPADPSLVVSRAGLAGFGATPGAGVIIALPRSACGLAETARIVGYLAGQSAGQCGPCVNGLPRLADTLVALTGPRPHPGLPAEVARLASIVTGRGACRHPDGTVRLIRSALHMFADDVTAHLHGHCLAHGRRTA